MSDFKTKDAASYDHLTGSFARFTEMLTRPLAETMVNLAGLHGEESIVDIGTGTGIVATTVTDLVDFRGDILGIDLSDGMLEAADQKIRDADLQDRIKLQKMDAENLDLESNSVDCVLSLFALLHFPNPDAALKEMFRILKPGGKLVLAVGSGPPWNLGGIAHRLTRVPDWLSAKSGKLFIAPGFLNEMVELHLPSVAKDEESALASKSKNRSRAVPVLVGDAGFKLTRTTWKGHEKELESPEEFWEIQRTFSSIARKRINEAAPDQVKELRNAFMERCNSLQSRKGRMIYTFAGLFVSAVKPA